jgi:hypothetical protein
MSKIKIDYAILVGIKADFVKGEVKVTLRMALETALEIRDELAGLADGEERVVVEISPKQTRLPFMEGMNKLPTKEAANGDAPAN